MCLRMNWNVRTRTAELPIRLSCQLNCRYNLNKIQLLRLIFLCQSIYFGQILFRKYKVGIGKCNDNSIKKKK